MKTLQCPPTTEAIIGCLLGTAVGDSLGLCCEGMSKRRQHRIYPEINGHNFIFDKGMTSDDTEHACMAAQALIVSGGNVQTFEKNLAWRLRFWLLGLPAGIGYATLRAIVKLWLGFPSHRSGVFSAGNGPAMRSTILGVCYGHDPTVLRGLVRGSTRMTHRDPKAEFGAIAVAVAAHMASQPSEEDVCPQEYYHALQCVLEREGNGFLELIRKAVTSVEAGHKTESFAEDLGLGNGVSGYMFLTVPVVLHAWLRHENDYRSAISDVIRCGGDTDTTAAILGGIVGARVGKAGIPQEWISGLWGWPRSATWMEQLGTRLSEACSEGIGQGALPIPVYGLFLRNLFFMSVVLIHGFRRLLPPY
ncbi:MAG: ADP-ribosylglycohydrolase family protein [Candidatus Methylomirabilales bacterium]